MGESKVSSEQAARLIQSGEWVTEAQLRGELAQYTFDIAQSWLPVSQLTSVQHESLSAGIKNALAAAGDVLIEVEDSITVQPVVNSPKGVLYQQVLTQFGSYRVIKISPTLHATKFSLISLACTTISFLMMDLREGALLLGKSLNDIRTVIRGIMNSWETITDPFEFAILELLCQHRVLTVINYDALNEGRYTAAYGAAQPATEDVLTLAAERLESSGSPVVQSISNLRDRKELLRSALYALNARGVIREEAGGWIVNL